MKTTHFRFKTLCYGRIYDDGVFEGTPYENDGQEISATTMARMYARYPQLSQFLERNKEEMTQYIDSENKPLEDVVRLELGDYGVFNGRFCLVHHVWIKGQPDEISEEELQAVEEYIMAQLSDGWGEGLEQREWLNHDVEWSRPYFDEESADFEDEYFRGTVSYYVVPWNAETKITQLDSEECELDVSAELIATMSIPFHRREVIKLHGDLALKMFLEDFNQGHLAKTIQNSPPFNNPTYYLVRDVDGNSGIEVLPRWVCENKEFAAVYDITVEDDMKVTKMPLVKALLELLK